MDAECRRSGRHGMTLIELTITIGIVSVLLALVLGLARHVNEIVKIRRAQAELGEWHESLNRWHLQFGEYPYRAPDATSEISSLTNEPLRNLSEIVRNAGIRLDPNTPALLFRSYLTLSTNAVTDPWNTPYIYLPASSKTYHLFSCGKDGKSIGINGGDEQSSLDDIYFEH